jgi:hypothetical protein
MQQGIEAKDALTVAETGRHNKATEVNAAAGNAESARHNKASEGLTARGQNMTDARSREANKTNVDLKNLKAQELQNQLNQQGIANEGAVASIQKTIDSVDRLGKHPGLSSSVGASASKVFTPGLPTAFGGEGWGSAMAGTDRASFEAELDTLKAQTFLPQVKEMKGMGALSDAEGKKLTDAIGALSPKMDEKTFRESLVRIREGLVQGKQRAVKLQQMNSQQPQAGGTIFARDPQGQLHQAPAGTPLPAGWKQENR